LTTGRKWSRVRDVRGLSKLAAIFLNSLANWLRDAIACVDTKPGADNVVKLDIIDALRKFLNGEDE